MTPLNRHRRDANKPEKLPAPDQPPSQGELELHGDVSGLTYAFVGHPRLLVTCPVPDSIYLKLQNHPGGISQFYEDAIGCFDGDLNALVEAAVSFVEHRRSQAGSDPPRNASGRVLPGTLQKIQQIQDALASIRGMSRAKVIAGLIQLHLGRL